MAVATNVMGQKHIAKTVVPGSDVAEEIESAWNCPLGCATIYVKKSTSANGVPEAPTID